MQAVVILHPLVHEWCHLVYLNRRPPTPLPPRQKDKLHHKPCIMEGDSYRSTIHTSTHKRALPSLAPTVEALSLGRDSTPMCLCCGQISQSRLRIVSELHFVQTWRVGAMRWMRRLGPMQHIYVLIIQPWRKGRDLECAVWWQAEMRRSETLCWMVGQVCNTGEVQDDKYPGNVGGQVALRWQWRGWVRCLTLAVGWT